MHNFIQSIAHISFLASFLAPIFTGEVGVIFLAFISAHGPIHFSTVVIFSSLGLIVLDCFWYWAIKHPWFEAKYASRLKNINYYTKLEKKIENFSHSSDIITLLISKILVGSRILVLSYLSLRKIKFYKFLIYNSIATLLWALIICAFGWFAGKGYYNFARTYHEITTVMLAIIVVSGIFYIIQCNLKKLF